ncbi:hypothetical protein [Deminuibacter soli]|uniref:Uncharacterized protein n=1 Tax=Deminuibacter soli TaxID=2291815 RepID=A0A3E1NHN7_9BACT|nr:hypothetical protein [Deminuibacter soli]RFM27298.1 hypothetical protein DXN05_14820 [Deminuibacter soli]
MGYLKLDMGCNEDDIRAQLNRLLKSAAFKSSTVLTTMLKYLVLEKLKGREDELKEYSIAVKGLNKPADFDPQQFAMIRIYAFRLRKLLELYYAGQGKYDPVKILIPKGSYKPEFSLNNMTAVPVQLPQQPVNNQRVVLAVFPFLSMNGSPVYDVLIDRLCEHMSLHLAGREGVRVISYALVRNYALQMDDLIKVGADLGAHVSVAGSISFQQAVLELSVQLIASGTGILWWTEKVQHAAQSESIESVAGQMAEMIYGVVAERLLAAD